MIGFIIFLIVGFFAWGITTSSSESLEKKENFGLGHILFWVLSFSFWSVYGLASVAIIINCSDVITDNFKDQKTMYFVYCTDYQHDTFSCPKDKQLSTRKKIAKASFDRQMVVFNNPTYAYKNCNVFDNNNWSCFDEKKSIYLHDGNYNQSYEGIYYPSKDKDGNPSPFPLEMQIEKVEYWFRSLKQLF